MRLFLILLLLPALSACTPIVRSHGNIVDDAQLEQVKPGVSRQADVVAVLGTPSAEGTFNPNEWYYIGQVTKQTAFFAPEVKNRDVVKVTFDPVTGTVTKVERLDKSAGQEIDLVERKTPTAGHNMTIMEQVLGNVGRFNPPDSK